jgi:hypothetical protein
MDYMKVDIWKGVLLYMGTRVYVDSDIREG